MTNPLLARVEDKRKDIKTDQLSMSIGELAHLYEKGEIDIHPKFQRVLRWSDAQKTGLIESIVLRIPIPPIFVSQDKKGKWDVVDGVQRLGTIFGFLGVLKAENNQIMTPTRLQKTKLIPEFGNMLFQSEVENECFPDELQLDFKRSRLDVQIILRDSDPGAKYELFERLNTGGANASPQEVRNCVLVWQNEALFDWLDKQIVANTNFDTSTLISERKADQGFAWELVLRFLSMYQIGEQSLAEIVDIHEFLNEQNRAMASDRTFDRVAFKHVFDSTFELLSTIGSDCFRRFDVVSEQFKGPFLISAFEAVAMGVAYNIQFWTQQSQPTDALLGRIKALWKNKEFTDNIGVGKAGRERVRFTIPVGRSHFSSAK